MRPALTAAFVNYAGSSNAVFRIGTSGGIVVGSAITSGQTAYRCATFISNKY